MGPDPAPPAGTCRSTTLPKGLLSCVIPNSGAAKPLSERLYHCPPLYLRATRTHAFGTVDLRDVLPVKMQTMAEEAEGVAMVDDT